MTIVIQSDMWAKLHRAKINNRWEYFSSLADARERAAEIDSVIHVEFVKIRKPSAKKVK